MTSLSSSGIIIKTVLLWREIVKKNLFVRLMIKVWTCDNFLMMTVWTYDIIFDDKEM